MKEINLNEVTVDGKTIEVPAGTTVLQAARLAGVQIPTLCDHPAVKPYGGCRLCVVEIEGSRVLQASCTLPVSNGMTVHTDTPRVHEARRFVLDLLFSERNHFCMYCQKTDGDCELQNAAYGEDMTHWPLKMNWHPYLVDASSPYFAIDHNRCILCRRCVRACADLVGNFTLEIESRGARSLLTADAGLPIGESSCVSCGACVQVCPTGAIIERESAYLGKDRQASRVKSVCAGCSVGCGIEMLVRDNLLIRIDGDLDAPVNGGVLCEQGRYKARQDDRQRLTAPMVRKNGHLEPVSWDEALDTLSNRLGALAGNADHGVAALASTRLTAEALFTFKQLFANRLNSGMVASIEEDLTTAYDPTIDQGHRLEALKSADCVLLLGADLATSHQVAGFFIKRNTPAGTSLIVVDPFDNHMGAAAGCTIQIEPGTDEVFLKAVMASLVHLGLNQSAAPEGLPDLQEAAQACGASVQSITTVAGELALAKKPVIVYGKGLKGSRRAAVIEALQSLREMVSSLALFNPKGKANSLTAYCYGLDRPFRPQGYQAVYVALGDDTATKRFLDYLEETPFLAVQASYRSPLTERADVVLPVECWAEQEGHFLNLEGRLQKAQRGVRSPANVRSNDEVLQALADCLGHENRNDWKTEILNHIQVIL